MAAPIDDLPTLDDKLEWNYELDRLSQRIQDCHTPHVLGIHGDWGSGKTSFMRQLQFRLGGEMPTDGSVNNHNASTSPKKNLKELRKKFFTIWFDAWRYQNEPVPVVALLHEMRRQMATLPMLLGKAGKITDISVRYALNSLADVAKVIGFEGMPSAEKIEKLGENWEKEHNAQALTSDTIRNQLHETIKCLLKVEGARVVVFIDDLDRCKPKAAFRLLEGLKIYLTIPNCVFVLGMNERILVDAIREEISAPKEMSAEELKLQAAHYVEKICTDIYRLPLPNDTVVLFSNWIANTQQRQALIAAIGKVVCLPPNPRRLKALANQWERFAQCVSFPTDTGDQEIWAVRVLVAAYIHQFHRDMWERWHYNTDFWDEIKGWCAGERGGLSSADGLDVNKAGKQEKDFSATVPRGPAWAVGLKPIYQVGWDDKSQPLQKQGFPNPGDIENFWIGALIYRYQDALAPNGFEPLLKRQQQVTPTAS